MTTKGYKTWNIVLRVISFLIMVVPIVVCVIIGFQQGEVHEKMVMGCSITIALILVLINVLMKYNIRSTLWICILGIYVCIDNILPLLLIIAIGTILDEFVITPLQKKCKNLYVINNQIDKRG